MSSQPQPALHPKIWSAVKVAWETGLLEYAIFDAFKELEAAIQARVGSAAIGDTLIDRAFAGTAAPPRIDISTNALDIQRIVQIFKGSIGLFKGSRSHGSQTPSIPAASDPDFALRILTFASALMDLLDRDVLLAPAFLGRPQAHDGVLTIWAERLSPTVTVVIDAAAVPITAHVGNALEISIGHLNAGTHQVVLEASGHQSRAEEFELPQIPPSGNWHRVLATRLEVFADERCSAPRPERAILLESLEGGHRYRRVFPSKSTADVGDYVSWEWDHSPAGVSESWVRIDGKTYYAWTGSTYFSGVGTTPTQPDRVVQILPCPRRVQLRAGSFLPLRVLAEHTDGVGIWHADVSDQMSLSSSDNSIAHIERGNVINAKRAGQCEVRIDGLQMHTEVSVSVSSFPRGAAVEYFSGLWGPRGIASRGDDLLVVDNSETIWMTNDRQRLTPWTTVGLPYLAAGGLDQIAVSESLNVAVRDLSTRRFLLLASDDNSKSIPLELPDESVAPMAAAWAGEALVVLDHTGGVWMFGDNEGIEATTAQYLWKTVSPPTAAWIDGTSLYVATGGGHLYEVDMGSGAIISDLLGGGGPTTPSAVAVENGRVWSCDFHLGTLWVYENGKWEQVGGGFRTPAALAIGSDGSIYVSELGADAIARILP